MITNVGVMKSIGRMNKGMSNKLEESDKKSLFGGWFSGNMSFRHHVRVIGQGGGRCSELDFQPCTFITPTCCTTSD